MNDTHSFTGTVWAVFGHRFAVEGQDGPVLADLGPKGSEGIAIAKGDTVSFTGERKPSEIKVTSLTLKDGTVREIAWPKKPHDEKKSHDEKKNADEKPVHEPADPAAAIAAVKAAGYAIEGEPKRKPKHFEIVGSKDGARHEVHVGLDGGIHKAKPLAA
jgi:hypothetical protein